MSKRKTLQDLTIKDNFIFVAVMLDVFLKDGDGTCFSVEMQVQNRKYSDVQGIITAK